MQSPLARPPGGPPGWARGIRTGAFLADSPRASGEQPRANPSPPAASSASGHAERPRPPGVCRDARPADSPRPAGEQPRADPWQPVAHGGAGHEEGPRLPGICKDSRPNDSPHASDVQPRADPSQPPARGAASHAESSRPPGGLPGWARDFLRGEFGAFDALLRVPAQSRVTMGWACLTLRLAAAHGRPLAPKESPFDGTLGYPGEGPYRPRLDVDVRSYRVSTPAVAARRRVRIREFKAWTLLTHSLSLEAVLALRPADLGRVVAEFGQTLYAAGRSLLDFAETINALVDIDRALTGCLPHAWDAAWVWRSLTPAGNRMPMPEKVMLAMITVALNWNLPHVALLIATGFMGLLRVHELRWLRFGSFVTPSLILVDDCTVLVIIEKPTMRRLGARRSYVRVDDPGLVMFAERFATAFPPDALVFDGTYVQLRNVFTALCREVGVQAGAPGGLTLGSLRPGGATWLYRATDCPETVRYRGRWASNRMLEINIQAVGAASVLPRLRPAARDRVAALAAAAPQVLAN